MEGIKERVGEGGGRQPAGASSPACTTMSCSFTCICGSRWVTLPITFASLHCSGSNRSCLNTTSAESFFPLQIQWNEDLGKPLFITALPMFPKTNGEQVCQFVPCLFRWECPIFSWFCLWNSLISQNQSFETLNLCAIWSSGTNNKTYTLSGQKLKLQIMLAQYSNFKELF